MPLKTLVKVGNITNLSDARYCAGMGVEMLGFSVVTGSESFIDAKRYQEIRGWVSGPKVVAEISGIAKAQVSEVIENYAPDYLELTVNDLSILAPEISIPLIIRIEEETFMSYREIIDSFKEQIAHIIIHQTKSSPAFIADLSKDFSILVSPDKDADINSILESLPIKGLALNGSLEIKPGLKDYDHLAEVLEVLDMD